MRWVYVSLAANISYFHVTRLQKWYSSQRSDCEYSIQTLCNVEKSQTCPCHLPIRLLFDPPPAALHSSEAKGCPVERVSEITLIKT